MLQNISIKKQFTIKTTLDKIDLWETASLFYRRKRMKKITLSNEYLSAFTLQISLLIHAGINIADGLHLLADDEKNSSVKELL